MGHPELYVPVKNSKSAKVRTKVKMEQAEKEEVPDCSSSFHVSLAWSLEAQESNDGGLEQAMPEEVKMLAARFACVKVKIGNTVNSLPLRTNRRGSNAAG
jgi:hypothetical protein